MEFCPYRSSPGHIWWDVCNCIDCQEEETFEADPSQRKAQIHVEDTPFSDVESLFSLDDEYSPQALVVMAYSTSEEGTDPDNDEIL